MRDRTYSSRDSQCSMAPWQVAAILGLVALAIGGVAAICRTRGLVPTCDCLVAVDISNSNSPRIDSEFALLELAVDQQLPGGTPLSLWTFGNFPMARKVYSATPDNGMAIWDVEKDVTSSIVPTDTGTYPTTSLREMLRGAEMSESKSVVCFLLWDGEIGGNQAEFADLAKRLAANPKVASLVCVGVVPGKGIRSQVEKIFECFGTRLIICGPCDRAQILQLSNKLKLHAAGL